jgi:drug/metabolite transporter (DMT)-like permease
MLLPILVLIICWTVNPFVKKKLMNLPDTSNNNIRPVDFLLVSNLIAITVVLLVYLYNSRDKLSIVDTVKSLTPIQWGYFAANAVVTLTATFLFVFVLEKGKITKLIPSIQSAVILFSFVIGMFVLKEDVSQYKLFSIALICLGIILLNF